MNPCVRAHRKADCRPAPQANPVRARHDFPHGRGRAPAALAVASVHAGPGDCAATSGQSTIALVELYESGPSSRVIAGVNRGAMLHSAFVARER